MDFASTLEMNGRILEEGYHGKIWSYHKVVHSYSQQTRRHELVSRDGGWLSSAFTPFHCYDTE